MIPARRILGMAGLLACVTWSVSSWAAKVAAQAPMGPLAPEFSWGSPSHTLAQTLGPQGTVLVFVSTRCPCSNDYAPRLLGLQEAYESKGFSFLYLNEDKISLYRPMTHPSVPLQYVLAALRRQGHALNLCEDAHDSVAKLYHVTVTPEVRVIDHGGHVRYAGRIDDNQMPALVTQKDTEMALDAILAGQTVPETRTEAIGCILDTSN